MPTANQRTTESSEFHTSIVILNGPSRLSWTDHTFHADTIVGCNWAFKDWPLTDCACVDKTMVTAINEYFNGSARPCEFWTKNHPQALPDWHHRSIPGIDSGSYAIEIALLRNQNPVLVIGADGILGGEHQTAYHYPWENKEPTARVHAIHRQSVVKLNRQHPNRLTFVWPQLDPDLKTQPFDQAKMLLAKYSIPEDL